MARLSKSEKAHNKEVKRVESIIKRLNKKNEYRINIDVSTLSTRKLKNIHGKMDVLKKGIATLTEEAYTARREAEYQKRISRRNKSIERRIGKLKYTEGNEVIDIAEGADTGFNNLGNNISRLSVYRGSDASVQIDMLLGIAQYGKVYTGRKVDKSAVPFVNMNGEKIYDLIERARRTHGDEALVAAIENSEWGSVKALAMQVERMVLAVYDRNYFEGNGFGSKWDEDMMELQIILEEMPVSLGVSRDVE